jgi:hypothetical protein
MVRIGTVQYLDDRPFGGLVHFGDEIIVPLASYRQQFHVARRAVDDRAGPPRGSDRDSEHRVHFFVRELKRAALLNAGF